MSRLCPARDPSPSASESLLISVSRSDCVSLISYHLSQAAPARRPYFNPVNTADHPSPPITGCPADTSTRLACRPHHFWTKPDTIPSSGSAECGEVIPSSGNSKFGGRVPWTRWLKPALVVSIAIQGGLHDGRTCRTRDQTRGLECGTANGMPDGIACGAVVSDVVHGKT